MSVSNKTKLITTRSNMLTQQDYLGLNIVTLFKNWIKLEKAYQQQLRICNVDEKCLRFIIINVRNSRQFCLKWRPFSSKINFAFGEIDCRRMMLCVRVPIARKKKVNINSLKMILFSGAFNKWALDIQLVAVNEANKGSIACGDKPRHVQCLLWYYW